MNGVSAARTGKGSTGSARPPIALRELRAAPVVLFRGPNRALADRGIRYLRKEILASKPEVEVLEYDASQCHPEQVALWVSPSLFGEEKLVILRGVDEASHPLADQLVRAMESTPDGVTFLLYHRGGTAHRKLVDTIRKSNYPIWSAEELKYESQRLSLVRDEVDQLQGRLLGNAAQMLIEGAGADLDELLGVTRRLVEDTGGQVTPEAVHAHFAGQIETDGFQVADAMVKGQGPRAVVLARRAFASGAQPVMVVAALAYKLRALAKVSVPGASQQELGMSPQAANHARSDLRSWTPEMLGRAICAVARADADVKGASKDPEGAVERCLIEISRARGA